jgi:hypothetical protein
MSERRLQWYNAINWQDEIIPMLEPLPVSGLKFLFHQNNNLYTSGTIPWFTQAWIKSKLNHSNDLKYLTNVCCVTNDNEEVHVLVQECPPVRLMEKQHNSHCIFSGLNGLILVADFFDPQLSKRDYWANLEEQMIVIESYIPKFAKVPLCVIYWPSVELSTGEFEENCSKAISKIFGSQIWKCKYQYLDISAVNFDSVTCTQNLIEGLAWLLHSVKVSSLSAGILNGNGGLRSNSFSVSDIRMVIQKSSRHYPKTIIFSA